ncbi:hypothetical protein HanXRQr2_Chr11g0480521 [Helianthus annuus]|uniref:Uncharacterized protein n=1 Tax=Helianthus annuus TaxID=4232 RepID=A0A251TAG1_HELAN|nr:hypothetical protein HanXRQr2_Chr11g0480521 [Helianthus annuus]KAJ0508462.1 hypothetical protein HanIR_Chr11g0517501 [Helianthus annuus]KAJ0874362.1 hypothetical protein HanPSC8_Chr11g0463261 [Helianthus annuus]
MNIQTKSFSVVGLSWCSHRYHCSCLFSLQSPFSSAGVEKVHLAKESSFCLCSWQWCFQGLL